MNTGGKLIWVAVAAGLLPTTPAPVASESGKHVIQVGRMLGAGGTQAALSVKAVGASLSQHSELLDSARYTNSEPKGSSLLTYIARRPQLNAPALGSVEHANGVPAR